jgi:hypothetical protein
MLIISSFRPHDGCPAEIWEQQLAANRSWQLIAPQIFYFNQPDARLRSKKTAFLPTKGKPSIKAMTAFCGGLNDWSAIVNADIVIPLNFRRVEEQLRGRGGACAICRRYTLPPDGNPAKAVLLNTDRGLDLLAAAPNVWKAASERIPPEFCMGRIVWDNWMVNFFMSEFGNHCYDLTPSKVCLHPQHEGRVDQNWRFPMDNPMLKKNNWPFHVVEI